jgi:hypothetical protein
LTVLNQLYAVLHDYSNFFLPTVKLKEKRRTGSKVTRVYEHPATPYQRVLTDPHISAKVKTQLRRHYQQLDVVTLRQQLDVLSRQLWASAQIVYPTTGTEPDRA